METKAIFLDVDGTLVSFDTHRVPQSAIEALQQVHESGIKIIIATGRAFTDLHELEEIPYDAVIALNGSDCVLRDGTPISRKQIPEKDFQRVLVLAQHYGFALAIETNKGILSTNSTRPSSNWPGWSITLHRRWQTSKKSLWEANVVSYAYIVMKKWKRSNGTTSRTFCFQMEPFLRGCQCGGSKQGYGYQ